MWEEIFTGPNHEAFASMLLEHSAKYCDETLGTVDLHLRLIHADSRRFTPIHAD
jgi:hypothetical protein